MTVWQNVESMRDKFVARKYDPTRGGARLSKGHLYSPVFKENYHNLFSLICLCARCWKVLWMWSLRVRIVLMQKLLVPVAMVQAALRARQALLHLITGERSVLELMLASKCSACVL